MGFMIFVKPIDALSRLYKNCKVTYISFTKIVKPIFGSFHCITMVFTHAKALGQRAY
jgi:hypothetical protein